jgi:type II secretory pathway component HofQ
MKHFLPLLLLAGCATAPAVTPRPVAPAPARVEPAPAPVVEQRYGCLDLDAQDEPLARVLLEVAEVADRPLIAQVSTQTTVTLTLHSAHWEDVLAYLVSSCHLVKRNVGRAIVVEEPPRNRLEASDADLSTWLLTVARQGGINIIMPGKLEGTVTASLSNVRYEDALKACAETHGLALEPVK